jgi:transcriptional regulator GlxA family with amidase domain
MSACRRIPMTTANKNTGNLKGESPEEYCAHELATRFGCDPRVLDLIDFMKANFHRRITKEDLSKSVGLSYSRLFDLFKADTGVSPMEHLRRLRMERAVQLLRETRLSVKEIVGRVGYNSRSVFLDDFKRSFGEPPTVYRKRFLAERRRRSSPKQEQ